MEALESTQSIERPRLLLVLPDAAEVLDIRELTVSAAHTLGRTILTGEEARLAQFANLTANLKPNRHPYLVR